MITDAAQPRQSVNLDHLTKWGVLSRNALWNVTGLVLPMGIALLTIPEIALRIGTERLGILMLAWAIAGYFNLFDFGLGRAVTKLVAEMAGCGRMDVVPRLFWTSLALLSGLGVFGTIIVAAAAPWILRQLGSVPPHLQSETLTAVYILSISVPFVVGASALRGLLEAIQRFDLVSATRVPLGILIYGGPLVVVFFSSSLVPITAALLVARVLVWVLTLVLCFRALPSLRLNSGRLQRDVLQRLFRFGGWMSVSNLISPIMVTFDRFVVASMLSVTAAAYYATPHELATKFLIVPGAILGVLFPAFSTTFAQDPARTEQLFSRTVKIVFLLMFPLIMFIVAFAESGLRWWLGDEFARQSRAPLQWLAVGILINSFAQVALALLHGIGKPDLTAKLHVLELPLFVAALFWLVPGFGITGAAIAWTLRVTLDAILLFYCSRRFWLPVASPTRLAVVIISSVGLLTAAALPILGLARVAFAVWSFLSFVALAWCVVLTSQERQYIRHGMRLLLA